VNIPISCKCITYGRADLLEEALYSFLIQEYDGDSELIIVNDYPYQRFHFDHPKVKIFNFNKTFDTIGAKENFAVSQCSYDTVAIWDDDDIAMPNHLSNINKYFGAESDLLHWQRGVAFNDGKISGISSLGNSGIVYSKRIVERLGGFPLENAGYDMTFVLAIKAISKNIVLASPPDDEVSWFYYWANRSYHMSGLGKDTDDRPNIIERYTEYLEDLRKQNKIPTGDIYLRPHWKLDYKQMLYDFLKQKV
jgi:hypothetical protein